MIELRFNAIRTNGQIVTGGLTAPTYREGKSQIHSLIEKHKLKLKSIEKKPPIHFPPRLSPPCKVKVNNPERNQSNSESRLSRILNMMRI